MIDRNKLKNGEIVWTITHDRNGLTAVVSGKVIGEHDSHHVIELIEPVPIQRTKYRRSVQLFHTQKEAQEELDYLSNYLQMRMQSHHKMK